MTNRACRPGSTVRSAGLLAAALAALAMAVVAAPRVARAQTLVVAQFTDKTGKVKLGKKVWTAVANALKNQGAKLLAYDQYLRTAKKNHVTASKALQPASIKKIAAAMKIDGVVTGAVLLQKKKYVVSLELLGADGNSLAKKAYSLAKPEFPDDTATEAVTEMMKSLGGGGATVANNTQTQTTPPPVEKTDDTKTQGNDAFLPPWARNDNKTGATGSTGASGSTGSTGTTGSTGSTGGGTTTANNTTTGSSGTAGGTSGEVRETAPESKKKISTGAIPEVLVDVGMTFNKRAGLSPRHESGLFPGLWFDAHFFMGTFLDVPGVRDIGLGGAFNMSLGLKYSRQNLSDDWSASQMQWRAELLYRLAFNEVILGPAILFHVGFGGTSCSIDATDPLAKSVGYMYPYAGVDFYFALWKPYLRLYFGGNYLFTLMTSDQATGSGMGFNIDAGLNVVLFGMLNIGVGWDMTQVFGFNVSGDTHQTSDTYQAFMAKVGWNFH